jgi:hypothetical protein
VADGEPSFGAEQTHAVSVRVEIGNVGNVVAFLLQPERERKFPEQKFAGAVADRPVVDRQPIKRDAVRPVEAHVIADARVPPVALVIIQAAPRGPAIVRLPRHVRALEEKVRLALIANDEDDVSLGLRRGDLEFAEIDATRPILRNLQFVAHVPFAFDERLLSIIGSRLRLACEPARAMHQASAFAAVVAHAIKIDLERRRRFRADEDLQRLACFDARLRAIAFDALLAFPQIVPARSDDLVVVEQQPIRAALLPVLADDRIFRAERAGRSRGNQQGDDEAKMCFHWMTVLSITN